METNGELGSPSVIQALSPDIAVSTPEKGLTSAHMQAAKRPSPGERLLHDIKITIPAQSKRLQPQPQLFSLQHLVLRRTATGRILTEARTQKLLHSPHPLWAHVICPCHHQMKYRICQV